MTNTAEQLNLEIGNAEATMNLSSGESFRIRGIIENVSETFIRVPLSNNPDGKGRQLVNINHIVSITWYV
ncbi:MAG TPA: hypothetical protein VFF74_05560 [Methylophilaceae bacterium]|nr:hypothetical protein [Methylophilaceae bacterium]